LELTGSTPVIELVAVRVVELARDGESDPDRLTEATVSTFEGQRSRRRSLARQRAVLAERRNQPRHDDRTDQRPDHQREDRDRSGYEHYARCVSHDFLGWQVSRHVEE
jgi:hypothetical protein